MSRFLLFLLLLPLFNACSSSEERAEIAPPNIIYILADDLGYGDLSCLNENSKIKTPALDALAQQGLYFTDAHSGSAVCSPTRYGILTGRYAWRSTLKNGVTWSYSAPIIDADRFTVGDLLLTPGEERP